MNNLKTKIVFALEKALKDLDITDVVVEIELPKHADHGDYSSNVALAVAKTLHVNPHELAEKIKEKVEFGISDLGFIEKVGIAGPGFINFWISKHALLQNLEAVNTQKEKFGTKSSTGEKVMVEFTDPNPFKELHVGHLYSNAIGESISRLFEANGYEVKRANYQGDVGLHVAKALYGLREKLKDERLEMEDLGEKDVKLRAKFLGEAYALGSKSYEDSKEAKKEIEVLNKKIFEKDESIKDLYEKGKAWSLEYFESIYKRLGTRFDYLYFESLAAPVGLEIVNEHLKKGIFEKSEGAVIFPGKKYGLHNRVFINSLGLPTYEAKELGLAPTKYKDFAYNLSVIITGNEIDEYFKVLLKALSLVNPDLAAKTRHLSHGMVRLPQGKMSSRTGNIITGESILDEAKERVAKKIEEVVRGENRSNSAKEQISEKVGIAAVKYAFLKNSIGKDVKFDFDEVVSFEGNSGPYLLYTYVRTRSILEKTEQNKYEFTTGVQLEKEEEMLLRMLLYYPEIMYLAAGTFAPNLLANYLHKLAQEFNLFYEKYSILESPTRDFRLALTEAVGQILKNGLTLLGIPMVERM